MVASLKKFARVLFESSFYGHVLIILDMSIVRVIRQFVKPSDRENRLLLIAAPGCGNIGDQALLEAALDNNRGLVVVIARTIEAVSIPNEYGARVTVKYLPQLIYGNPLRRYIDYWQFCKMAINSTEVWVVGADVMDGAYNPLGSLSRFSCSLAAARLGCEARILGFSWNSHSVPSASVYAAKACREVTMFARDPQSFERLEKEDIKAVLAADIVFARSMTDTGGNSARRWIDQQKRSGKRVLVVNASGLLAQTVDQPLEIADFVKGLGSDDWAILLLPHVIRPGNDDLAILSSVEFPVDYSVLTVDELVSPSAIFRIVSEVDLVVTGRMHLAVLATLAGRYSITLASQGKVEGLYGLLEMPENCIAPRAGYGQVVGQLIRDLLEDGNLDSGVSSEQIVKMSQLAARNFA